MTESLLCWRCGASLEKLSLPLARLDECPACAIPLHVCRMCRHYDAAVPRACREDDADDVKEKERPNFCDFFVPSKDAYDSGHSASERRAQTDLSALFGEGVDKVDEQPAADDRSAADDLFK